MVELQRVGNRYLILTSVDKSLLNRLLKNTTAESWEAARQIVLAQIPDKMTLEDAVRAVSIFGWRYTVPDPFTIRRALRFAARLAD